MRLLLDTHAFLWWIADDERLSRKARRAIADARNDVLLSAVSAWEIVVKASLGRLQIPERPERFVPEQMAENAFGALPLAVSHALKVASLPVVHRDPFDRLLAAQALCEGLTLVTGDRALGKYPVKVLW